jgi:magnesium transporter
VDHSVRLTEEIDTGRDLLASAMDAYLSYNNNRLSAVTARLTLIATIFLPLNFIVGFFGMNLEILPPVVAIPLVLTVVVSLPAALYLFFKRKRLL